jgi:hypothetical protein
MTEDDATNLGADDDLSFDAGVDAAETEVDEGLDFAPLETEGQEEEPSPYEDLEEVSHNGETFTIPKALKPALMMQADYTRKTQELAHQRRSWEAQRAEQAEALGVNFAERARLVAIDDSLEELETLDWRALEAVDPHAAQALWAEYSQLAQARGDLAAALEHQGREEALEAQRDHAMRIQDGLEVLARDIDGWSPELAGKLMQFGHAELGFSHEEMSQAMDPRLIKLLHRAYDGATRIHQHQRAEGIARAQRTSPARTLRGSGGGLRVAADTSDFAAFERLADARMK